MTNKTSIVSMLRPMFYAAFPDDKISVYHDPITYTIKIELSFEDKIYNSFITREEIENDLNRVLADRFIQLQDIKKKFKAENNGHSDTPTSNRSDNKI